MTFSTDLPGDLAPETLAALACIAGHMIPACDAPAMPGADDPAIVRAMVAALNRDRAALLAALSAIDACAGGAIAALPLTAQETLLSRLRQEQPALFPVIEAVVARAYYRDDRVLHAIGMPMRPPFPLGYDVEPGDWSLLDPVRRMGKRYR
jgi:hypothetical protein